MLEPLKDNHTIEVVLECKNTESAPKSRKNFLYYLLALWTRATIKELRSRDFTSLLSSNTSRVTFEAIDVGLWQINPLDNQDLWNQCDVMIKFGMGLLKNPESLNLTHGVISYHHGDPTAYRGRPAGFYEILNNEKVCGVIVQEINNKLDGGKILSKAYAEVESGSYRDTLAKLYLAGIPLLRKALSEYSYPDYDKNEELGTNYRLPDNKTLFRFNVLMLERRAKKYLKMFLWKKNWVVSHTVINIHNYFEIAEKDLINFPNPENTSFVADPFWIVGKEFICEGWDSKLFPNPRVSCKKLLDCCCDRDCKENKAVIPNTY